MLNRSSEHNGANTKTWPNGHYKLNGHQVPDSQELSALLQHTPDRKWLSWTTVTDQIDPLAYLEHRSHESDLSYWETPEQDLAIAAGGAVAILKATGRDRFREISRQSLQLQKERLVLSSVHHSLADPILLGGYSFFDHNVCDEWKPFGAARFVLPEWCLIRSGKLHLLTINLAIEDRSTDQIATELETKSAAFREQSLAVHKTPTPQKRKSPERPLNLKPDRTFQEWRSQVNRSRVEIENSTFQKIVLSRQLRIRSDHEIQMPRVLYHFRNRFPACFNFLFKADGKATFAGASPERLISLHRSMIRTEGLAGSIGRGESAIEDLALGRYLMESRKERSEHQFVVQDIRDNLRSIARHIEHPREPRIKKLNNVQHLYTPITAEVDRSMTIHQLVETLHPTPAVGGFPAQDAVPHISRIEGNDRGWYAGPVGWFSLSGNGEFAVAIRSALVRNNSAKLFAGSGIVRDSDPEREWQETTLKFNPVLEAIRQATGQEHE